MHGELIRERTRYGKIKSGWAHQGQLKSASSLQDFYTNKRGALGATIAFFCEQTRGCRNIIACQIGSGMLKLQGEIFLAVSPRRTVLTTTTGRN
jgi:hypothetical protein